MPAKSKSQQAFFAMIDQGKIPAPKGVTKRVAEEFASTKTKGLPSHVKNSKFKDWHALNSKGPGD